MFTALKNFFYNLLAMTKEKRLDSIGSPIVEDKSITSDKLDNTLLATINNKASIEQVNQIVVDRVIETGGSIQATPFTPSTLGNDLAILLDSADSSSIQTSQSFSWINRGSIIGTFTPINNAPTYINNAVVFANSPLKFSTTVPIIGDFTIYAIVRNVDFSKTMDILWFTYFTALLGIDANKVFGFIQTDFHTRVNRPISSVMGTHLLVFSYTQATNRLRISIDGGESSIQYPLESQLTNSNADILIGCSRANPGSTDNMFSGSLLELGYLTSSELPTIRKIEGYSRVVKSVILPDTHPYAIIAPTVEDTKIYNYTPKAS